MTNWKITVVKQAEPEFYGLPVSLQGKFLAIFDLVEKDGLAKVPPKRRKHLKGDIWEFRVNAIEGIAQALYVARNKEIIVLAAFIKKTEKTPNSILELAAKRSKEV
ncbi:MAG: type II toxin-antitoxin system RelE/ParE family toxin [Synergistaceae bacterium]|jgi:phage-related protein|nr:type II toxin-antitoxin system RelE/ParE family toxin [Synergistaceae bacterium]